MTLDLGNATDNVILIDKSGAITISATVTGASRSLTLSGSGSGALTLSASNSYTGTTQLTTGKLRAGSDAAFGTSVLLLNGGTISSDGATARSFANAMTLGGDVAIGDAAGAGPLSFGGSVGLGGVVRTVTTTVTTTFAGAVTNGDLTKAGAATLSLTNSGNSFGTLTVNAGTASIRGNTTVTGLAGSSGALELVAGTLTVNASTGGTTALPFGGSGGFTKAGGGLLSLTGDSGGYAGTTTILAGTLAANGVLGGAITVASGATLAGSGTVGGVTLSTGATLAPGNSPGVLTTGDLTWAGGGNYNWQLHDASLGAGPGWDRVAGGALTITASPTSRFNLNLWSLSGLPDTSGPALNFSFTTSGTFTIGTFSSVSGADGDWYTINTGATNGTGGFTGYKPALGGFTLVSTGTSIDLVYTHTPLTLHSYVGGTGAWSDTANWSLGDGPEGDAAITLDGPGGVATNDLLSGTGASLLGTVRSLSFTGSATGSYEVAGNAIKLGSGGVANDSAFAQTFSAVITIVSPAALTANGATLTFSGTIDTAGHALTVGGAAATTLGAVAGTGSLVKIDSGTVRLTAAVASPTVTIAGGLLALDGGNLLADSGTVTINSGSLGMSGFSDTVGAFGITGGALGGSGTLTAATYSLGGGTVAANLGAGSATSTAGSTTLTGNLTVSGGTVALASAGRLGVGSAVAVAAGRLTLSGSETMASFSQSGGSVGGTGRITAGGYTLTGGTTTVGFAGSGGVTVNSGNPTLAGDGTGFTGATAIGGGTLTLANGNALGSGAVILSAGSLRASAGQTVANAITIGGSGGAVLYSQNFNAIGSGLPSGWTTGTGAGGSSVGTSVAFTTRPASWGDSTGAFKNFAATTGLTSVSSPTVQSNSTDRALGIRQTASFGDPGAAFTYAFSTTGQVIDSVSLDLMLLSSQGYSTTWSIQYGVGTSPTTFTTLGTWTDPGTWGTTSLTWSGASVSGMSNLANGVFRVVALSPATGSDNRDTIGIDNFSMLLKAQASATLGVADASAATYSGPITVAGTAMLTAGAGGSATFSGAISGALGSVAKTGLGVVALAGTSSYAGTTTVSEGTLTVLAGSKLAGTSGVTISSGATLRSSGEIGASGSSIPVTVNGILSGSGLVFGTVGGMGSIDPGDSPGILTVSQVDPTGGIDHNFEFTSLAPVYATSGAGALNDILHLTGTMPFAAALSGAAGNAVNIYFNHDSFAEGLTYSGGFFADSSPSPEAFLANVSSAWFNYFVADVLGDTTYQGVTYRSLADWNAAHAQVVRIEVGAIAVVDAGFRTGSTRGYVTVFSAAPEPSTMTLAGVGLAAAWALRRRRTATRS